MTHTDLGPVQMTTGYSSDTQILTRRSWLPLPQLTRSDEVATRSPAGAFEWQRPRDIRSQRHDGELIHFSSRTTDLLVALDQLVLHGARQRKRVAGRLTELPQREALTTASELIGDDHISLIGTSRWAGGRRPGSFTFDAVLAGQQAAGGRPPMQFTATPDDFAAFMGAWLAEGYLGPSGPGGYPIYICQSSKGNGYREYQHLLDRMLRREVPWQRSSEHWCFSSKALYTYLDRCGRYAWEKRIPAEILDLPPVQLARFWHHYWLGDGTTMRSEGRQDIQSASTTSRQLADGLQEILQKLGGWSIIHKVKPGGRHGDRPQYRLVRRAGSVAFAAATSAAWHDRIVQVVTANPAVYVRRNDHPVWCGSS